MYSACFSMKMLLSKLAQMGNFCLAKSDAMWPMAQMATDSASLAPMKDTAKPLPGNVHNINVLKD